MFTGLERVTARRVWFVPEFSIWGTAGWADFDLMVVENTDGVESILFDSISLGETTQEISFAELTDFRGNSLPETITNPRVIVRPRGDAGGFVVGEETDQKFKIARTSEASGPVMVDLLVIEMGR